MGVETRVRGLAAAPDVGIEPPRSRAPRIAALCTVYHHNSHADVIVSRLLQTDTLDGKGRRSPLQLVSLYTDQVPENDISRRLSQEHSVPIFPTIADALTLGTGTLAVDGVLLVAEHGKYPHSPTGNTQYPKRRFFEQVVQVFRQSGRVVPVFIDKHLSDNWQDAAWIYRTARELNIPVIAGSSLPTLWRRPPADISRGSQVEEMVGVSYHTLDHYGFHGLEMLQCLAEQRAGGETGIKAVQCLTGPAVWAAAEKGTFSADLLRQALDRLEAPQSGSRPLRERVPDPTLFRLEYRDGLRATLLTLNGAVNEWAVAWRLRGGATNSTLFWTQEARPFMHFTYLLNGFEEMVLTGRAPWPVERTLLTSGTLDALLISRQQEGKRLPTPWLNVTYRSTWRWRRPPPPPPGRPIMAQ